MSDEIISNQSRDEKLIRIGLNIRKLRRARDITETAPKIGLVAHFNLGLVAHINFGLSARFNFGLIA